MSKPSEKPEAGRTIQRKIADYNAVLSDVVELLDRARCASARVVNTLMTATWTGSSLGLDQSSAAEKVTGHFRKPGLEMPAHSL